MAVLNIREFPDELAYELKVYAAQVKKTAREVVIEAVSEKLTVEVKETPKPAKPREVVETAIAPIPENTVPVWPVATDEEVIQKSIQDGWIQPAKKRRPLKPKCEHGTEKGYRCWQCGGVAQIGKES
jgi:hypothetical protein